MCLENQGSHRGHREHGENKHRGVRALAFRGADFQSAFLWEHLGTPNFSLAWFHLFIGSVPKPASRRKRPFFSRRRDTPFIRSEGQKSGFAQRARRTQRGQASRRKRSFFSRRRDTLFRRAKKGSRGPVGYPAIPHGHRGVSAFSFRDGAIPFLERHRADRGVLLVTPR